MKILVAQMVHFATSPRLVSRGREARWQNGERLAGPTLRVWFRHPTCGMDHLAKRAREWDGSGRLPDLDRPRRERRTGGAYEHQR
jgi:hypothetical protein